MAHEDRAPFGEQLRRLRVSVTLSHEALAERAGLCVQAIGALETDQRCRLNPRAVATLTGALGLSEREQAALARARVSTASAAAPSAPALPRRLTPLVGRERDVRAIVELSHGPERQVRLRWLAA